MKPKSVNIDAYLEAVPDTHRAALSHLCDQIRAMCPEATEHISYGHPLFKFHGHPLVGVSAHKKHSSFFVWSDKAFAALRDVLKGFDTAESTLRFEPNQPPPVEIVKAVVEFRKREISDRWG